MGTPDRHSARHLTSASLRVTGGRSAFKSARVVLRYMILCSGLWVHILMELVYEVDEDMPVVLCGGFSNSLGGTGANSINVSRHIS
jgi:hypothetical protein